MMTDQEDCVRCNPEVILSRLAVLESNLKEVRKIVSNGMTTKLAVLEKDVERLIWHKEYVKEQLEGKTGMRVQMQSFEDELKATSKEIAEFKMEFREMRDTLTNLAWSILKRALGYGAAIVFVIMCLMEFFTK